MSKEKINEVLEEFGRRYGFVAKLNDDNICALTADGVEKVYVEYIADSDRVTVYANLFAHSEQALEMDQLKLVMLMNIELFAKTGGIVALHPVTESPVLCWGADADVLPAEALINVLLNIVELIKIVRDKLDLRESSGSAQAIPSANVNSAAPAPRAGAPVPPKAPVPPAGARPPAPAQAAAPAAPKPAAPTAPPAKPAAAAGGSLQDMLMNQLKK
ncbi:MAG: hypothetical protein RLZZ210_97 [Pseudomonadota bacterium]|jgi:hypothetical protein